MATTTPTTSQAPQQSQQESQQQSNLTHLDGGSERRRGLRIAQNRPIKVFEPTTARYLGGQTRDVSATGLQIELPLSAPVFEGKQLSIHVGIDGIGQTLANRRQMIPARIVWINRPLLAAAGARVTVGVEFISSIAAHLDAA